jgi:hypothetical protein
VGWWVGGCVGYRKDAVFLGESAIGIDVAMRQGAVGITKLKQFVLLDSKVVLSNDHLNLFFGLFWPLWPAPFYNKYY